MTQEELHYRLVTQLINSAEDAAERRFPFEAEFFLEEYPFWVGILDVSADVSTEIRSALVWAPQESEMTASRTDISGWFDRGVEEGATHLIVVCDSWDYEDYPVFVKSGEDAREKASEYSGKNMQRVMEVYSLSQDKEQQMAEHRAFHYD